MPFVTQSYQIKLINSVFLFCSISLSRGSLIDLTEELFVNCYKSSVVKSVYLQNCKSVQYNVQVTLCFVVTYTLTVELFPQYSVQSRNLFFSSLFPRHKYIYIIIFNLCTVTYYIAISITVHHHGTVICFSQKLTSMFFLLL